MRILKVMLLVGCAAAGGAFSACKNDDASIAPNDAGAIPSDGTTTSGDAGDGSPTCAAIADAQCRRYERCSPLLVHALMGVLAECKERLTLLCERTTQAPGAAPYTTACLTALENPSCEPFDEQQTCVAPGALADGAPCEFGNQCATGRCSSVGGSDGCGTCRAPTKPAWKPAGAECRNDDCDRGQSCVGFSWSVSTGDTLGKCETTRTLGQECTDTEDCNGGGRCGGDGCPLTYAFACLDGRCALPLDEGVKCPLAPNTSPACDVRKELLCQFGTDGALCRKIIFANEGEPCRKTEGPAPGTCIGSTRCVSDAGAGTCVRKRAEGEACTDEDECRFGAACRGGLCTIDPPDRCK